MISSTFTKMQFLDQLAPVSPTQSSRIILSNTVELQWLEHLWNNENMFEAGVVRAN